ncbi:hypothetical protein [Pectinatus haikarae]|uniref:NADH pyrophosphatase NudC (Nudix superfamily) n=1 Tax=Pectinatus haikarae TaxID=349096 RepID=A0ABT9Y8C1_9FIRM|nr:hypothetical protein [Pectinatus haikarae]MDQ0204085.1 NADH pyrophosphatase NudC (nudix superfamily) [Pectinatus haikarae]
MEVFVAGLSDKENTRYCPKCGTKIYEWSGDDAGKCDECDFKFYVIEKVENNE